MTEILRREIRVTPVAAGRRLDQHLAELFPEFSRARLQQWVRRGEIRVDDQVVKPGYRLHGAELIAVAARQRTETALEAQSIPLSIVHQDEHLIVVDKPAGLVVHPAAGNPDRTLANALLAHDPQLKAVPRAGIVHRLDKLTSGLMVVARTLSTHAHLVAQLQARRVSRVYRAVAYGAVVAGGTIDEPLGRHARDRKRVAVRADGKPAVTHYRVRQRFADFTDLAVTLETGRTHQIRVHLAHRGHPLVGDPVYGGRLRLPPGAGEPLQAVLRQFRRQALHAQKLRFVHPADGVEVAFEAPLPADLAQLLEALRDDERQRQPDST